MASAVKRFSSEQFKESLQQKQATPDGLLLKSYTTEIIKEVQDTSSRVCQFVISTGDVDRDGDTINPLGWDIANFQAGGSVLWAHDSSQPPVAKPVSVFLEGGKLKARCEFPTADVYAFGDTVYKLIQGGYLRATSVGFKPKKWTEADRDGFMPLDFQEQELLEFSIVPVPSNPKALIEAKAAGVDLAPYIKWVEQSLDIVTKSGLFVSREVLENAYKSIAPTSVVVTNKDTVVKVEDKSTQSDDGEHKETEKTTTPVVEKAGRVLSAKSVEQIKTAMVHTKAAMEHHKNAADSHAEAFKCMKAMVDSMEDGDADDKDESDQGDNSDAATASSSTQETKATESTDVVKVAETIETSQPNGSDDEFSEDDVTTILKIFNASVALKIAQNDGRIL